MRDRLRPYGTRIIGSVALAAIAAVLGVVSYLHIYKLTLLMHQPPLVAHLMPFGVDGLMIVGSAVLLSGENMGWLCVGPGFLISLYANIESGIGYGIRPALWAGVPALCLFLATFVLERWLKRLAVPKAVPGEGTDEDALSEDAQKVLDGLTAGQSPTFRVIRGALSCGDGRAKRVYAELDAYLKRVPESAAA